MTKRMLKKSYQAFLMYTFFYFFIVFYQPSSLSLITLEVCCVAFYLFFTCVYQLKVCHKQKLSYLISARNERQCEICCKKLQNGKNDMRNMICYLIQFNVRVTLQQCGYGFITGALFRFFILKLNLFNRVNRQFWILLKLLVRSLETFFSILGHFDFSND